MKKLKFEISRWIIAWTMIMMTIISGAATGAEKVEVFFNLPAGIENYSGVQPVTFGVPFEKGKLLAGEVVRLVDAKGNPVPGQFEVTATWGPGSKEVRWLLVDGLAQVENGKAQPAFLEFGKGVPPACPPTALTVKEQDRGVVVATGVRNFTVGGQAGMLGQFALTDGAGKVYRPGGKAGDYEILIEKKGAVRVVIKCQGKYLADDGSSIADFVVRIRFYAGCPFARVYHTLIWTVDEKTQIGSLTYTAPEGGKTVSVGVDGQSRTLPAGDALYQRDWNVVAGAGEGKQLDGWVETTGREKLLVALRWPWQQFPVSFRADQGRPVVGLIGPEKPLSLVAADAAVEAVKKTGKRLENGGFEIWDSNPNVGPASGKPDRKLGWLSPRGVGKTHELLVWYGDEGVPASLKNILLQHPVLACADPKFTVQAALPSPASAYDPRSFPEVEGALERAFGWATREQAIDGDYGLWNYGDLQWAWVEMGGYTVYRYWMNHGKGWSILPWALWLRSGDRRYWENGEANSRHCMDIDICHVDDWAKEGKPRDGKVKGGVYHYCALHWAYGPRPLVFYCDSEYLPNYYYMTGYERARDVMMERVQVILDIPSASLETNLFQPAETPERNSRHTYIPLKELLLLFEATGDPTLGQYASRLMDLVLTSQEENGHFFGVKTNHYLDLTLHIARRVLGDANGRIAKAITRWVKFNGDNEQGGPVINIENGWASLWSLLVAGEQTGEPRYLCHASRIMWSQAAVVDDSQTEWRGLCPIFIHEIGPALRDWVIVMSALAKIPPAQRDLTYEPMTYICGRPDPTAEDKAAGWKYREMALLLSEKGEAVQAKLYMWGGGVGEMAGRLRVRAPDGNLLIDEARTPAFAGQYGAKSKQAISGPLMVDIPAGKAGVYVVEVLMKDRAPCLHLRPSNGKVVYLLPPKALKFFFSPVYAGQVWFEPLGTEPVSFSYPANQVMGRMLLFGPDGKLVVTQQVTGTRQVKATDHGLRPDSQPIRFDPGKTGSGLYSLVTPEPRDKNCYVYISGCKPYFACRRSEWFDPTKFPCPDLPALIKGMLTP